VAENEIIGVTVVENLNTTIINPGGYLINQHPGRKRVDRRVVRLRAVMFSWALLCTLFS
jgi:hypothetical protein